MHFEPAFYSLGAGRSMAKSGTGMGTAAFVLSSPKGCESEEAKPVTAGEGDFGQLYEVRGHIRVDMGWAVPGCK